ncbi:MAG TPA: gamma carbonic anhydrase family protein [Polyangiaceae bacterium]|nr:gamma carbonic anhydrase family protein [Polyangiaceae bacterium]
MAVHELKGVRPTLGRDVFVADSAAVIGDVHLGEQASVWFGAVVRGDYCPIRVGARTNVQDNVVVHIANETGPTTIGDDVTVGHAAVVHACTVGHRCLIGIGSVILDGAVVGDESFVAAGTLVTPRTIIPPRSFVLGRPSKVVRPVTEAELAWIRRSASDYVRFAHEFLGSCKRIA